MRMLLMASAVWIAAGCQNQPLPLTDAEKYLQDPDRLPWLTVVTFKKDGTVELTGQYQLSPEEHQQQKKGALANTVGNGGYPCTSPFWEASDGSSIDYGDHLCLVDEGTNNSYPATPALSTYCLVPSNCSLGNWNAHIRSFRAGYMSLSSGAHIYYKGTDCTAFYGSHGITWGVGDVDAAHTTSCEQNGDHFSFIDFIP